MSKVYEEEEEEEEEDDRISDLPDHILNHIFSFLPSIIEVIRMSPVCKRWRRLSLSFPFLEEFMELEKYLNSQWMMSSRSVYSYSINNATFKLQLHDHPYSYEEGIIDRFLISVLEISKITLKEFDLCFIPSCNYSRNGWYFTSAFPHHCLPISISLTTLKLKGIRLTTNFSIYFPSLTNLCLNDVEFVENYEEYYEEDYEEDVVEYHPGTKFPVEYHRGTKFPFIFPTLTSMSLTHIEFKEGTLQKLISGCPFIEDLEFYEIYPFSFSGLDLTVCRELTSLSFGFNRFTDQWLQHLISRLPLLEKLTLKLCHGLKRFNIHSQSLKYLCCTHPFSDINATLYTPNLLYFGYECGKVDLIFRINSLNHLLEASLKLNSPCQPPCCSGDFDESWYSDMWYSHLLKLLANLNCSNTLSLDAPSEKALLIPENMREISPLPYLKHLKLKLHNSSGSINSELRDALSWFAPSLETLEIDYC